MYSGYYQYELNANLIGAEKLFEAMGYTLLPNQTLMLDGPICPDQVTNVSRDAMAAYVECQVIQIERNECFLHRILLTFSFRWAHADYETNILGVDNVAVSDDMAGDF